jgi:hypothetical protein
MSFPRRLLIVEQGPASQNGVAAPFAKCALRCDGHHKMSDFGALTVRRFTVAARALSQSGYTSDCSLGQWRKL